MLKEKPALVDSTSPRRGEKASYYSAVCLETGEVEVMGLAGNSNAATATTFLRQLRARHIGPLTVIWDNSTAHRGTSPVVHADETGGWADGHNGYVWTFSTPTERYFLRRGRGKEVVDEALGDSFSGVLVRDFYDVYHHYDGPKNAAGTTCCGTSMISEPYTLMMNNRRDGRTPSTECIPRPKLSSIPSHDDGVPHNWHWNGGCWTSVVPFSTTRRRRPPDYPDALNSTSGNSLSLWPNRTCQRTTPPPSAACATWSSVARSGGTCSEWGTQSRMTLASLCGTWRAPGLNSLASCRQLLISPQL